MFLRVARICQISATAFADITWYYETELGDAATATDIRGSK